MQKSIAQNYYSYLDFNIAKKGYLTLLLQPNQSYTNKVCCH